jgi:hypothetical protein
MDRIRLPPFRKEWHTGSSIVDRHSCHLLEKGGTRFPQSRPLSTTRLPLHFFSSSLSCTASVSVVVVVRALARSLARVCVFLSSSYSSSAALHHGLGSRGFFERCCHQ